MGENIKLARLRRGWSSENLSERAGVSRSTLISIENGSPSVTMGHYAAVLFVLGFDNEIANVGSQDEDGRRLQDLKLTSPAKRSRVTSKTHEE